MGKIPDLIFYQTLPVLKNEKIAAKFFILSLQTAEMARGAFPGQFAMLKPERSSVLLGRPYSVYKREGDILSFLYKIYGKGSRELSRVKSGEKINIWGPLGKGFQETSLREWAFVAGGVGVAPFLFLAQEAPKNISMTLYFGIKNKDQAILQKEFEDLNCKVIFVTEDGSYGEKGWVTDAVKKFLDQKLKTQNSKLIPIELFTCGPRLMEKAVAQLAQEYHLRCQVAFEEYMGCGLGTCMGCVVKCHNGKEGQYERVCREGPVFMADHIVWE
ncbi:MAG: dihydroorotate dehydrogenase electron transfer subunit [Chlamydiae bacterium]|nr:dihydroorotate dehydrogenase electron transfer subunit [Chlamydiota bacterium]